MNNEIVQILESLLSLGVAFLCVQLSKYRYQENEKFAAMYEHNTKLLIIRVIITEIFKWGSIAMIIVIINKTLSVFIAFYILTPLLIAFHIVFFNSDYLRGIMTFTKGVYYVGLTIISIIQIFSATTNVSEFALGFTLSLAIFESTTALDDGYKNMKKYNK